MGDSEGDGAPTVAANPAGLSSISGVGLGVGGFVSELDALHPPLRATASTSRSARPRPGVEWRMSSAFWKCLRQAARI